MDREELERGGVDYGGAMDRFMGNQALYEKFLLKFPTDATFPALREALEADDCQAAFMQAHTLKGLTGNLSLDSLAKLAVPMVEALRGGDLAAAKALFPALEAEYDRLCAAIQAAR